MPHAALSGIAGLTHLGVIRVDGEDAAKFLQGQLTQDVALLGLTQARLAAFCNAKGRMQASFIVFKRSPDEILLVCSRDILAATLKRLSMFVLRAKAKLSDATAEFALFGLAGDAIESIAGGAQPLGQKPILVLQIWCFCTPATASRARCGVRRPARPRPGRRALLCKPGSGWRCSPASP